MNKIFKVAKQELKMTAANKAFVIITIIGPFLIVALSVIPTLLTSGTAVSEGSKIGLVGAPADLEGSLSRALSYSGIETVSGPGFEQMRTLLQEETLQGILVIPPDYVNARSYDYFSRTGTDLLVIETLNGVINHIALTQRLKQAGLNPESVQQLSFKADIAVRKLSRSGEEVVGRGFMDIFMTSFSFVMLIYMTVLLYGQMIGRSVVTEKTSKTVEIILSSVSPKDLMFGKILGIGTAGILQYSFWIIIAAVVIKFLGPALNLSLPGSLTLGNLLYLSLFFICAYFLYASAYAALGSGSEDEQHLGQLAMPLLLLLIIPLITISSVIMNPKSTFALVLSYIPFTSPIIMLARILVDKPPAAQILLCFAILIGTILLMVFLAAKIFRVGILMTGKRFKLAEIIKWVKY